MEIEEHSCIKCGYSLTGLAPQGSCPECGNEYDLFTGKGTAEADNDGRRSAARGMWLTVGCLVTTAVVIMGCAGLASVKANDFRKPLALGACAAVLPVMMALNVWLTKREENRQRDDMLDEY